MDRLFLLLRENKDSYIGGADSFTDRISNQYTVSILGKFFFQKLDKYIP